MKKEWIIINYYSVPKKYRTDYYSDWAWSSREVNDKELYMRDLTPKAAKRKIKEYRKRFPSLNYESRLLNTGTTVYTLCGFFTR